MKNLTLFLACIALMLLGGCVSKPQIAERPDIDTLSVCHEHVIKVGELEKSLLLYKDSVRYFTDSIPLETYMNARRIEQIKYYISITKNKPSNQKFFYGWILRIMEE